MGRLRKKGDRGAAVNFISRNNALKKLQLSLPDFRRLCILKGIYPREPHNTKKLKGGPNATYYYAKDIQYLAHEPLLHKFREFKHFMKRMKKAMGKRDEDTTKRLEDSKPVYAVDHLVKERYPAFVDAVRDLDDVLCMVFLFRIMPRTTKVKEDVVTACDRLAREFMKYVIHSGSLRKVFLSIKGIYYQAEIMGQTVTWIAPYTFNQKVPSDVDFRVMLTFLEFYTTMLGFVNFKLYNDMNLHYPPKLDSVADSMGGGLSALVLERKDAGVNVAGENVDEMITESAEDQQKQLEESKARVATLQSALKKIERAGADADDMDAEAAASDPAVVDEVQLDSFVARAPGGDELEGMKEVMAKEEETRKYKNLFKNCKFFLSREVPCESLEFVIRSMGGQASWEQVTEDGEVTASSYAMSEPTITHHVVDRPKLLSGHSFEGRVYVQPQWVYDCVNAGKLLPVEPYSMNAILPPHLSPFVEYQPGDYVPGERDAEDEAEEDAEEAEEEAEGEEEDEETMYAKELEAEAKGVSYSEAAPAASAKKGVKRTAAEREEEEEKELAKMMMSKKHKRLYNKIMHSKSQKQAEVTKLQERKKAADTAAKQSKKRKTA